MHDQQQKTRTEHASEQQHEGPLDDGSFLKSCQCALHGAQQGGATVVMRAQDNVADLSSMKERFGFRSVRSGRQVEATEAVSAGLRACAGLWLASPEPSSEPEDPSPSTLLTSVSSSSSSPSSSSEGAALTFNWPAQCEKKAMHLVRMACHTRHGMFTVPRMDSCLCRWLVHLPFCQVNEAKAGQANTYMLMNPVPHGSKPATACPFDNEYYATKI